MKKTFSIAAKLSELSLVRDEIKNFIDTLFDDTDAGRVILAIDEAVTNVIVHGYKSDESKTIEIDMESDADVVTFSISDTAPEYNPLDYADPDIEKYHESGESSGLGVNIYRRIMEVRYEQKEGGGNRLILIKEKRNEDK